MLWHRFEEYLHIELSLNPHAFNMKIVPEQEDFFPPSINPSIMYISNIVSSGWECVCVPSPNSSTWEHFGEMVLQRNTFLSSNSWWLDISAASLTERLSRLLAKRRVIHLGAVIHKVLVIIMKAQIINKPRKGTDELDQEWKMEVALVESHVPGHCPQHRREAKEMKNVLRSSTRWWKGLENLT